MASRRPSSSSTWTPSPRWSGSRWTSTCKSPSWPVRSYRLLADHIGREYQRAQAKKIFRNLLDVSATLTIQEQKVIVKLDKRAHNPFLVSSGLADKPTPMPWFGGKRLVIRFA